MIVRGGRSTEEEEEEEEGDKHEPEPLSKLTPAHCLQNY
jgi:hypothetical protein